MGMGGGGEPRSRTKLARYSSSILGLQRIQDTLLADRLGGEALDDGLRESGVFGLFGFVRRVLEGYEEFVAFGDIQGSRGTRAPPVNLALMVLSTVLSLGPGVGALWMLAKGVARAG